jgi:hypothetical protein
VEPLEVTEPKEPLGQEAMEERRWSDGEPWSPLKPLDAMDLLAWRRWSPWR